MLTYNCGTPYFYVNSVNDEKVSAEIINYFSGSGHDTGGHIL